MKPTTANFDTANTAAKKPVVIMSFSGLTRRYSTGTFANINTTNDKTYIKSIQLVPTKTDLLTNNIQSGVAVVEIVDVDRDVSDLIVQNNLNKISVTFKFGFQSIDDSDFLDFAGWELGNMQPGKGKKSWIFQFKDASRLFARKIGQFEQGTNLDGSFDIKIDTTVPVDSTSGFIDPTNIPAAIRKYLSPAIIIDGRELVTYETLSTSPQEFQDISRLGMLPVGTLAHDDDIEVRQAVVFHENQTGEVTLDHDPSILKIYLHLLLTTDDGAGGFYDLTSYDSAFKGFGFDFTESEVDIDEIENLEGLILFNTSDYGFSGTGGFVGALHGEQNGFEYLTKNFLVAFGIYHRMSSENKISLGTFDPTEFISNFSAVKTFIDDDVSDFNYAINWDRLLSRIRIAGRYFATDEVRPLNTYKLDEAVTDYGAIDKDFEITTNTPTTDANAAFIQYCFLRRWFYIFGNPHANVIFESKLSDIVYELGDHIDFTLTNEIDLTGASSSLGWTNKKAVITGGPEISIVRNENNVNVNVSYRAMILDIQDKVSSTQTELDDIIEGDMDDATLDPAGTDDDAQAAEDAYVDLSPAEAAHAYRFRITWDNPNTGVGENNFFSITLRAQSPAGTNIFSALASPYIRYETDNDNTVTRDFFVVDKDLTATTIDRIKFDVHNLRDQDEAAVASADEPQNLKVTLIKRSTLDGTISTI